MEVLLGALGTCLSIGYALNATARGIELRSLALELEGDIDLTVFGGLAQEGNPGYSNIRVRVDVDGDADTDALQALHEHVLRTSPILSTVARPVDVTTELRIASSRLAEDASACTAARPAATPGGFDTLPGWC